MSEISLKRNRLHTQRATDLVYVYEALRIQELKKLGKPKRCDREQVEGVEDDLSAATESGEDADIED